MFHDIRRNLGFKNRNTCAIQVTHIKEEEEKNKSAIENAIENAAAQFQS